MVRGVNACVCVDWLGKCARLFKSHLHYFRPAFIIAYGLMPLLFFLLWFCAEANELAILVHHEKDQESKYILEKKNDKIQHLLDQAKQMQHCKYSCVWFSHSSLVAASEVNTSPQTHPQMRMARHVWKLLLINLVRLLPTSRSSGSHNAVQNYLPVPAVHLRHNMF